MSLDLPTLKALEMAVAASQAANVGDLSHLMAGKEEGVDFSVRTLPGPQSADSDLAGGHDVASS
ncbi:hypothetical protein D3C73_1132450 [compost metagenome]